MVLESSGLSYSNFHETDSDLLTTSRMQGESGSGEVEKQDSRNLCIILMNEWIKVYTRDRL